MTQSDFLPTVTDPLAAPEVRVAAWREELLGRIVKGTLVVGGIACVIGAYFAAQAALWHISALNIGVIVALVAQVVWRHRLPFDVRVTAFLMLGLGLGTAFMREAPTIALLYLSTVPLLTALFLGLRASAFSLMFTTSLLFFMCWLFDLHWPIKGLESSPWRQWFLMSTNFLIVNGIITVSTAVLIRNLQRTTEEAITAQTKLQQLAMFDVLTGLPNRRLLADRLSNTLNQALRTDMKGAVLFIDLDHFKNVNDTHGHAVGDNFLKMAANRLVQVLRRGDTLARLGGDEFVVLLASLSADADTAAHSAQVTADKLRASMEVPFEIADKAYSFSASIGVALFPKIGQTADDLLREADTAMYSAKQSGRNRVVFFEASMQIELRQRLELENDLAQALQKGELSLAVQSQCKAGGAVSGAEVLLRWKHPVRGQVSPADFIPVAEHTGLIVQIGDWVLQEAFALVQQLHDQGRKLPISVNISPRQFYQSGFVEHVRMLMKRHSIGPGDVVFEVTEGLLIKDRDDTIARMHELVALGLQFSIDDFGTGYSSLNYLRRLPLFELKIDKSFVNDATTDAADAAIVRMILSMATELKLKVVAEGVETQAQVDFLASHGCHSMQGYFYSRPQPVAAWLTALSQPTAVQPILPA